MLEKTVVLCYNIEEMAQTDDLRYGRREGKLL
jgi:hypothetical protein